MYTLAPQLEVANSVVARTLYKSRKNHRQVQSTAGSVRPYEGGKRATATAAELAAGITAAEELESVAAGTGSTASWLGLATAKMVLTCHCTTARGGQRRL
jgi:hypothetical protein